MAAQPDLSKLSVGQFAERFRSEMIPLSNTFSYFCASVPLSEEDLKEYLEEPIASLPPAISALLPKVSIMLVPYLERVDGKEKGSDRDEFVCTEKPPENRLSWATQVRFDNEEVLVFALQDQDVSEYHYRFYHVLATLAGNLWSEEAQIQYCSLLREELNAAVHGEVDEESWHMKQALLRGEIRHMARLLNHSWEAKKRTAGGISTDKIEQLYQCAFAEGAIGGKVSAPAKTLRNVTASTCDITGAVTSARAPELAGPDHERAVEQTGPFQVLE